MIPGHDLKIVLVEPEIPQNTGNIARLCAATGAALHLVRPLAFFLTDKYLKRAGMDYLKEVKMVVHDDLSSLTAKIGGDPVVVTSGLSGRAHWEARYTRNTWVIFGKESAGLPAEILEHYRNDLVRIPMREGVRGLNLSTCAGIILYEGLRQLSAGL